MHRTNPDSLRSCPCFRFFRSNFASDFFNLLLVKFLQAEIIAMKHLFQGATTRLGWELNHQPCDYGRRKNDAPNHSDTLPSFLRTSDGVEHSASEYEYRKKLRVQVLILKNVLEYEYRKKVRVRVLLEI